jgi:Tol biopolymer transport system component
MQERQVEMKLKRFVVLAAILLTSCAPVQNVPISTAAATLISTATSTPAPTATDTPVPTPVGGSGKLMLVVDHEIKVINPGGIDEEIMISRQEFEQRFPLLPGYVYRYSIISPDAQKIIVAVCRYRGFSRCMDYTIRLSTIDGSQSSIIASNSGVPVWSPDSKKILIEAGRTGRQVFSADEHFGAFVDLPGASTAFWSYDSQLIYYYDKGWYTVKPDGTDIQALKCDICKMGSEPSSYAVAQSPDGQRIALGLSDGTLVITNPDLTDFKFATLGSYVNNVHWSPDSSSLVVDTSSGSGGSDISILAADGSIIQKLQKPDGIEFVNICGWSPDSRLITYIALRDSGGDLYLQSLGAEEPILLASFQPGESTCPIWLTGQS